MLLFFKFGSIFKKNVIIVKILTFCKGSLIWAKMKGYPCWPAKVDGEPMGNKIPIFFFGTHETAAMYPRSLALFDSCQDFPARKSQAFQEALREIESESGKNEELGTEEMVPASPAKLKQTPVLPVVSMLDDSITSVESSLEDEVKEVDVMEGKKEHHLLELERERNEELATPEKVPACLSNLQQDPITPVASMLDDSITSLEVLSLEDEDKEVVEKKDHSLELLVGAMEGGGQVRGEYQQGCMGKFKSKPLDQFSWRGLIRHVYKTNGTMCCACDGKKAKPIAQAMIKHIERGSHDFKNNMMLIIKATIS